MTISRNTLLTIALIASLAFGGFESYQAYKWKHWVEDKQHLTDAAAVYLFGPTGLKDKNGHDIRRVDLVDPILHKLAEQAKLLKD